MNTIKKSYQFLTLLGLIALVSVSCDKDFTNIESDITGIKNFETSSLKFPLVSYSQKVTSDIAGVQTNGLPGSLLGVYVDPNTNLGTMTAGLVTQLTPTNFSTDFGENPTITSVKLNIPYHSTPLITDLEGNSTYQLDSLFGTPNAPFKISIYQSNYVLRDLDPASNFEEAQAYYSNQEDIFCAQIGQLLYESHPLPMDPNPEFFSGYPSPDEIHVMELNEDTMELEIAERFPPALRIDLNDPAFVPTDFWKNLILDNQDDPVLSNANNFNEFFRGLIFKIEPIGTEGSAVVIDFESAEANVLVDYTNDAEIAAEAAGEDFSIVTAFRLNFSGNKVNTINNNIILPAPNTTEGDDQLYLKGGDGVMSVIELFNGELLDNNGIQILDENDLPANPLTYFEDKKESWIINEANLIFYVDQNNVQGDEPERVMLYDLKNNLPIVDYFLDGSTTTEAPNDSKINYSQILERDENDNGIRYKFRLTEHINNMLIRDSTNVRLGLYVSSNVNLIQNSKITGIDNDDDDGTIDSTPASSILSPQGTVLYGSKPNLPEGQRAEFEIFYTEPEN